LLELLGYGSDDVDKIYGESLFDKNAREPAFTTGDIFGLFSSKQRRYPLDLSKDYLESVAVKPGTPLAHETTSGGVVAQ
jgi:hypothetical protein